MQMRHFLFLFAIGVAVKGLIWGGRIKGWRFEGFTQEAFIMAALATAIGFIFLYALKQEWTYFHFVRSYPFRISGILSCRKNLIN